MKRIIDKAKKKGETLASDFLPYTRHVTETILGLRSGAIMTTLELSGVSFNTADISDLNDFHGKLNLLWRNVNDDRFALYTHMVRVQVSSYPDGTFRSGFSAALDKKYREKISQEALYTNRLFLTVLRAPHAGTTSGQFARRLSKARRRGHEVDPQAIQNLNEVTSDIMQALNRYRPKRLSLYREGEQHETGNDRKGFEGAGEDHGNKLIFSEPMTFLNALSTYSFDPIPLVDGPLSGALIPDRPLFGHEMVELRGPGSSRFLGILGVKEYPATTRPGMLNGLLSAPFECVLSQSFVMMAKADARTIMTRKQNQMINTADRAFSQVDGLDNALDDLESNRFTMGTHHVNIAVSAPDPANLLDSMSAARRLLSDAGLVIAREDFALEQCFWGQWPGNLDRRPRSANITSRNFAALSSFHTYPAGESGSIWGPPICVLKTPASGAFNFNLHTADRGSTFLCGPTGSGKTVVQNFLLSQAEKLDATVVFFDKDRGAEIFIRAARGTYLALKNGQPTGCAPFKALDLNDAGDYAFAVVLLTRLVMRDGRELTVTETREIEFALSQLKSLPRPQRSIHALRSFMSQRDTEGSGARLERWMKGGALGWALDGDADELALDARFIGFDMTDFLANPEIRSPMMIYLFYRIQKLMDGRRIIIDIDEFWQALADEYFTEFVRNKLKTIRKQNGLMLFGTQEAGDAIESSIGRTIIEQCPTKIFMPNPHANPDDYIDGFGLTHREFDLIRNQLTSESRRFLVKQGHNSVVVELDLNGFGDELAILSGRTEAIERLDRIRAIVGDDPTRWMPHFLSGKDPSTIGEAA